MHGRTLVGKAGEEQVALYLQRNGFTILATNYAQQTGEIDLIASKQDLLIFVEVKTRAGSPFDMSLVITPSKQRKIISVAKKYLARHDHSTKGCRFDVALLNTTSNRLTYLEDAFREE